jgi:DNA-binding NarL/FixJ family response regulator
MNTSPIYIVVEDTDDEEIIREAFVEAGVHNELRFFSTGEGVLNELRTNKVTPFIIISDVNLPRMDGFELREKILQEASINDKSIPFIFWSTRASEAQIKRAYDLSAHGFFLKGRTFTELKERIHEMVAYWSDSLAPNQKTH